MLSHLQGNHSQHTALGSYLKWNIFFGLAPIISRSGRRSDLRLSGCSAESTISHNTGPILGAHGEEEPLETGLSLAPHALTITRLFIDPSEHGLPFQRLPLATDETIHRQLIDQDLTSSYFSAWPCRTTPHTDTSAHHPAPSLPTDCVCARAASNHK